MKIATCQCFVFNCRNLGRRLLSHHSCSSNIRYTPQKNNYNSHLIFIISFTFFNLCKHSLMIIQGRDLPNGWPFGLGNMNMRLSAREGVEGVVDAREPNTFHGPTSSFSSFSSSNLDTESTVSFFQDNSVSLGRLIGIRPRDNGTLYYTRTSCIPKQRPQSSKVSSNDHHENSHGVCVPNLLNILVKMSRSKSHSS